MIRIPLVAVSLSYRESKISPFPMFVFVVIIIVVVITIYMDGMSLMQAIAIGTPVGIVVALIVVVTACTSIAVVLVVTSIARIRVQESAWLNGKSFRCQANANGMTMLFFTVGKGSRTLVAVSIKQIRLFVVLLIVFHIRIVLVLRQNRSSPFLGLHIGLLYWFRLSDVTERNSLFFTFDNSYRTPLLLTTV